MIRPPKISPSIILSACLWCLHVVTTHAVLRGLQRPLLEKNAMWIAGSNDEGALHFPTFILDDKQKNIVMDFLHLELGSNFKPSHQKQLDRPQVKWWAIAALRLSWPLVITATGEAPFRLKKNICEERNCAREHWEPPVGEKSSPTVVWSLSKQTNNNNKIQIQLWPPDGIIGSLLEELTMCHNNV